MKKRIRINYRKTDYANKLREIDKLYQRKRRLLNKEWKKEQNKLWRLKNPEKSRAEALINQRIIRSGVNIKGKCRDCKRKDTHKHHPDYSKPEEIIWLCPSHHQLEHLKIKGRKKLAEKIIKI